VTGFPDADGIRREQRDRMDEWLDVLSGLVERPSENPPGDTRAVADYLRSVLDGYGIDHETVAPEERMPNVLATVEGTAGDPEAGPHLTFNGHLDTYEAGERDRWDRDPFSGAVTEERIHGRGTADMHGGFVATLAAFVYLSDHRDAFAGRATLAAVSDEESGGTWGTEYLVDERPDHVGGAVLNGEPSAGSVRFAERGPLWLELSVRGESAHSALPAGVNAVDSLVDVLSALRADDGLAALADVPDDVRAAIEAGRAETDAVYGEGATEFALAPTLDVGTVEGGGTVNLTPETARAEVDVRLPIGTATGDALAWAREVAAGHPGEVSVEAFNRFEPTYTDPDHPLLESLRDHAAAVTGERPPLACGHGFTDLRFYRAAGAPAAYHGPTPHNMGSQNEYITRREFREAVLVHTLAAAEFVAGGAG